MIGVDTNVLLRYLLKDDAAQAGRAERELERDERGFSRTDIGAALDRSLRGLAGFRLL